jgi:hypothetical protein
MRRTPASVLLCLLAVTLPVSGQDFTILQRIVQMHGFASQGFVDTNQNNWLTMHTSKGSGAFTDFGFNVSTFVTDKLHIGAQLYDRDLGNLGEWHPSLDWAVVDYKLNRSISMRGGKVKTRLGLHNDTQDLDFLHPFVLLPQSVYPTDLRDATIAHTGGDVYGTVSPKPHWGSLAYTIYAGHRSDSIYSGYPYLLTQFGTHFRSYGGLQYGADLRWETPWKGLLLGLSRMNEDIRGSGTSVNQFNPGMIISYSESSRADWTNQFYGQYSRGPMQIDAEYRRYVRDQMIFGGASENPIDVRGWYMSGAYRLVKRVQIGAYYSHYTVQSFLKGSLAFLDPVPTPLSLPENHVFDKVVAGRIDLNRWWNVKLEGHFMDGFGNAPYPDGFYPQVNPSGFKRETNALVLKTGVNF